MADQKELGLVSVDPDIEQAALDYQQALTGDDQEKIRQRLIVLGVVTRLRMPEGEDDLATFTASQFEAVTHQSFPLALETERSKWMFMRRTLGGIAFGWYYDREKKIPRRYDPEGDELVQALLNRDSRITFPHASAAKP